MSETSVESTSQRFRAGGSGLLGLHALLVPMHGLNLLLPNAAVAEVIRYEAPTPVGGVPDWWLGRLNWRGTQIPLLSFEGFIGAPQAPEAERRRIAVLHTLNGNPVLPWIAVVAAGTPQLQGVTPDALAPADDETSPPGVLCRVSLRGRAAVVPDLDALESLALAAKGRAVGAGAR